MAKKPETDDTYAKESFTFRGMQTWQLWSITIVAIAVVAGLLIYANM